MSDIPGGSGAPFLSQPNLLSGPSVVATDAGFATVGSPAAAASQSATSYESLATFGLWTSIAGAGLQAIGNYYAAQSQKSQLKSQALAADFQQSMSALNARAAEEEAQAITEAGNREQSRIAAQYGQVKAGERAATAARGIKAGVGSAAEVQASIELAKQIDVFTVNSNAVRAANAARTQATNERNRSLLAGTSAANLRDTAGSIDPYAAVAGSLLGSASGISSQYLARERYRNSRAGVIR